MATPAALVPVREPVQIRIVKNAAELQRSAFALLDAYAQRNISLGELVRQRREELGLTHVQVMDRSGYFLYKSRDLAALEVGDLASVHDIWFTILCDPLELDYEQFFGAHEGSRPRPSETRPNLLLEVEEIEDISDIVLPELNGHKSRRSRSCKLGKDWLTRQVMAEMAGMTVATAVSLADRVITLNPELAQWRKTMPMGKSQRQTLYHRQLVRHMLLHEQNEASRLNWPKLPQLAKQLKAEPDEVDAVIRQLVKQELLPESCQWRNLSARGRVEIYCHPDLQQAIRQPVEAYKQEHRWRGKSDLAQQLGTTPADVDWIAQHFIKMGSAPARQRRVVGRRKNAEVVQYHPELARQIQGRFETARRKRRAEAEEAKQQRALAKLQQKQERKLRVRQERKPANPHYVGWETRSRLALQGGVTPTRVDEIAQQLIADDCTLQSKRAVTGSRGGKENLGYHPELARLISISLQAEKQQRKEQRETQRKEAREKRAEAIQQLKGERGRKQEVRQRRRTWLDRAQVAQCLGVNLEAVDRAIGQLFGDGQSPATHPQMEMLFAPEMVEQITQILRESSFAG